MAKKIDNKEIKSNKKVKSKRKIFLLIIPVIIIVCIIGFIWFTLTTDVVNAQLIVESGTVQVKHVGGSWISAENSMLLSQSDSVKTGDNTSASIILFESSIIRLDNNTEVTIQELIQLDEETSVKIKQDAGRTWNTISKMSGIDNYDVQTPTTVASVRGTAFVVIVQSNGTTYYGVAHGILNVSYVSNGTIQGVVDLDENESVIAYVDMVNISLEIKPFVMDDWVLENLLEDEQFRIDLKEELYSRIEPYIPELKEQYGLTDQELEVLIDGYIMGYFDLPPDTPEWARELFELS
ncbi:MAG: FecR domain-containing protein [Thermoplasmatales archaeon]|nr:MAG: FecR domain-containing protein [Thermoplasmatales archaeon]